MELLTEFIKRSPVHFWVKDDCAPFENILEVNQLTERQMKWVKLAVSIAELLKVSWIS